MRNKKLTLLSLDISLGICKLSAEAKVPDWINGINDFVSITRTDEELSIVCPERVIPKEVQAEFGWRALKVKGELDFSLTGILFSIAKPLANNSISIFAISTYNTDYVLVKQENFDEAINILSKNFKIE
ncbi:ACT domain-containing protein [Sporohalobacter salinus]|uniref:ACT domain-containing protein n=1 Tax=Sporohalobacter salinus TaxID=1494606 RepID=UPI00196182A1|nr:ACT domain-containing protein [Sporohalobacter salinus]MBM7623676.1 hypothetical protein [Sporohalobacter salinus]